MCVVLVYSQRASVSVTLSHEVKATNTILSVASYHASSICYMAMFTLAKSQVVCNVPSVQDCCWLSSH